MFWNTAGRFSSVIVFGNPRVKSTSMYPMIRRLFNAKCTRGRWTVGMPNVLRKQLNVTTLYTNIVQPLSPSSKHETHDLLPQPRGAPEDGPGSSSGAPRGYLGCTRSKVAALPLGSCAAGGSAAGAQGTGPMQYEKEPLQ